MDDKIDKLLVIIMDNTNICSDKMPSTSQHTIQIMVSVFFLQKFPSLIDPKIAYFWHLLF